MPVKYLPAMRSLAKKTRLPAKRPKWKKSLRPGVKVGLAVGAGAIGAGAYHKSKKKKRK